MSSLRTAGFVLRGVVALASALACIHSASSAPVAMSTSSVQGTSAVMGSYGASPEITDAGVAALDAGADAGLRQPDSSYLANAFEDLGNEAGTRPPGGPRVLSARAASKP